MKVRTVLSVALLCAASLASGSCVRDEILEVRKNYRVEYDIDDSVLYNKPREAELIWLRFYDPVTGVRLRETYAYPSGTDLYIDPGRYTIVAYTYQNSSTKFTYPESFPILTAETEVSQESPYVVMASPSHFYAGVLEDYEVPLVSGRDSVHVIRIPMSSPLDSWRVEVTGVKNLGYARTLAFFITDQYRDMLFDGYRGEGSAVLSVSGYVSKDRIVSAFNTFGMIPGRTYELQLAITDASSTSFRRTVDVTDQVLDPSNTEHVLTFDWDISLQTMVQGGMTPSAEEWDVEREHTVIH